VIPVVQNYANQQAMPKYNRPRLAGYRIIRQIIPGPNATPADIEKAIIRSQQLGEKSSYSKYVDQNVYSKAPVQNYSNYYSNGYSNGNGYSNYSRIKPIITSEQMYVPHKNRNNNNSNSTASID